MTNSKTDNGVMGKTSPILYEFEQNCNRGTSIPLPQEILCFEILASANITKQEKMLVPSWNDFSQMSELFDMDKFKEH